MQPRSAPRSAPAAGRRPPPMSASRRDPRCRGAGREEPAPGASRPARRAALGPVAPGVGRTGPPRQSGRAPPGRFTDQVTVRRGDTLMDILSRAGIAAGGGPCRRAVAAYGVRSAPPARRPGTVIQAANEPAEAGARRLLGLDFDFDFDHAVRVTRDADGRYAAAKVASPQRRDLLHRAGTIDDSLYMSAERAVAP